MSRIRLCHSDIVRRSAGQWPPCYRRSRRHRHGRPLGRRALVDRACAIGARLSHRGANVKDKKLIAVIGATGAQGGGLARAILDDPDGGFAVRAITRHVDSDKAKRARRARRGSRRGRPRRSRQPRTRVRRARTARTASPTSGSTSRRRRSTRRRATWRRRRRRQACATSIWSTLEDTRERVPLADARMPTLMGKYKVPHFDAKGEADALLPRSRRADHLPADLVLLGQPHPLRHGPEARRRRRARVHAADGRRRSCRASPPRTSAAARTASSSAATNSSARPSASPAST